MFEVEPADSPDEQVHHDQLRRLAFYDRLGGSRLDVNYRLPTESGSQAMYLYFRPAPGVHLLPKEQIQQAVVAASEYIHGDLIHREAVLKGFLHTVTDHHT